MKTPIKSKKAAQALAAVLIVSAFSTTAFAGGHGGGHHRTGTTASKVSYSVCTVDDCNTSYNHTHNGKYYYGHNYHSTNVHH